MKNKAECAVKFALNIKKRYDSAHISAYAAQAAFFVLLSAVPLVMFGVILLGALVPFDFTGINDMLQQTVGRTFGDYLVGILHQIADHSTVPLASLTMLFLLWSATKGIRSIADGIGTIYGNRRHYNILQLTLRAAGYTFVLLGVFVLSLAVLVFSSPLENLLQRLFAGRADFVLQLLNMRNIIFFLALTVLFATAYRYLAKSGLSFVHQLYGGAFAAAGWIVFSFGFSLYIKYFSRYSALYGSLGGVMLFMLWLYMCMNILLCGALVAQMRWEKQQM